MNGFASTFKSCDKLSSKLYKNSDIFSADFMTGLDKIFADGKRANSPLDASFMIHQVAFVLKHTGDVMQKEAGMFKKQDLTPYSA